MLSKDSTPLIWKSFVGPDLFGSVLLPHIIYHNVNLPSFAGHQNKVYPKDFLTEILYTFPTLL